MEREEVDPMNWNTYKENVHAFTEDIVDKVHRLRTSIASKAPDEAVPSQGDGRGVPGANGAAAALSCYKEYKRDDLPSYKGDIRGYPPFKREWTRLVAPGRSEDWQLQALQKRTPEEMVQPNPNPASAEDGDCISFSPN